MIVKLIVRIIVFVSMISLISYVALYIYPDYKKEYVAGVIPKIKKLKEVKTKKIVIIGGSNATFGIDNDLMERQLGLPVANIALHGGLPLKYLLEQVKLYVNKGDIIILAREYDGLLGDHRWAHMSGTELPKVTTYNLSEAYILLSNRTLFETTIASVFNTIKLYIKSYPVEGRKEVTSVYDARAFKKDNLLPQFMQGLYKAKIEEHPLPLPDANSLVVKGLKKAKYYFDNKGVDFYLTAPVITKGYYKETDIVSFWDFLNKNTEIKLLNKEKTYTYDKKYFLNSHYHTNESGRKLRTASLIVDILDKGLVNEETKKRKTIYVSYKETIDHANLDSLNDIYNFTILKKDPDGILVKHSGGLDHNYFRIKFENKDYKGYNFYMRLKCDQEVIDNIRFRGTGALLRFDTVISVGDSTYEVWKKMNKVLWTNNNSYLGISFPNNEILQNKSFTVKDVGVYKNFGKEDLTVDNYPIVLNNDEKLYFEVVSEREEFNLKDIVEFKKDLADVKLKSNQLYIIEKNENTLFIKDFYSNSVFLETSNMISFKSSGEIVVKVYE